MAKRKHRQQFDIPMWDIRHPAKQIANRYIATYRDMYPDTPNLEALEYAVNAALQEIAEAGYTVLADHGGLSVESVSLSYADENRLTVEFHVYDT